ncbi:hypothetical protein M407DRAFT_242857 [Tulasnella calospora MUT 4182]|uniref:FAD/NAD(P)-binding domain-containing protein n=1 Tax=Tulasnella calospora MUT 4182 TaxID=1051891 RepID=A0A0C3L4Q3_9AGAM|nr:hypothetical protein M407DRAFT_242857 [Tulasnella calospora MUT 4182]
MSAKKNIVIIGAGSAGVHTAQGLSKALNPAEWSIQLVSNRQFHVHYVAMLRVLITDEGGLASKALNPLDKVFEAGKPGEIVYGEVLSVEDGAVNLDDGKKLPYDYLVIASGTSWEGPLAIPKTVEENDKWIAEWREKFVKANDIVILGGGAVGTELSGELKHFYPNKHVTLVHAEEYLLNATYPPKFRKTVTDNLKGYGINVILDDKATLPEQPFTSVTTEKGQKVDADLVVPTWGGRRNTGYLNSFDSTILTPEGNIRVLPSLRVPLSNGKTNVYAAGDVIDWDEQKQLAKVPGHAGVVVANILASIQGKSASKTYKGPPMEVILLPAGPTKGAAYFGVLWGLTFGDWVTSLIKSKTLLVWLAQQTTRYN